MVWYQKALLINVCIHGEGVLCNLFGSDFIGDMDFFHL